MFFQVIRCDDLGYWAAPTRKNTTVKVNTSTIPLSRFLNIFFFAILCLSANRLSSQNNEQVFISSGAATWTAPACITTVTVQCWGGGGAGGSATTNNTGTSSAGGGGSGGAFAQKVITVVPGTTYSLNVAASQTTNGAAGNDSWFGSMVTVIAKGGAGGLNVVDGANGTGGMGTTIGSIGDPGLVFAGGNGSIGNYSGTGGAGGGGAGSTATGGNAAGGTAGAGGASDGGAGGSGVASTGNGKNGNSGTSYGGGGSGGAAPGNKATSKNGGAGAGGKIVISWAPLIVSVNQPFTCSGQSTTLTANGATTYSWAPGGELTSSINVSPASTTSYTVTGSTNGCSASAVSTVSVYSPVQVNSKTICSGASAILTASGAESYSWAPGGETTSSITVSVGSTTSYTVTGTSCSSSSTAVSTVTIDCPPSECTNANIESCDFTGWSGSTSKGPSGNTPNYPDPFRYPGMMLGSNNQLSTNDSPEASQFIMNSGYDPIVGSDLPVLFPDGGTCSARLGNAQVDGGGEVLSYKMLVNTNNSLFTYNYAVVLDNSSDHDQYETPYFKIRLWVYSGTNNSDSLLIDCATYDVNPLTAPSIGGFVSVGNLGEAGAYEYKPWSAVTIPLQAYIGQTVKIEFITRDCSPQATAAGPDGTGTHFAYAYIDAICAPPIITSTPDCSNATLTAPAGAISYSWSGPGIVSGANSQVATVNIAGEYIATMTTSTSGNCTYTLSINAVILPTLDITVSSASVCPGETVTLTASGADTYSWSNGATTNSITVSPSASTSYTVSGSATGGCSGTAISTIDMLSAPTIVVEPKVICVGETTTLTASGASGYSWSTGSTSNSITVSPTSTSTYSVSGTGCPNMATPSVSVNPLPVITVNSPTICNGETTTLTASGAGSGGDAYSWSTGAAVNSITDNPTSTTSYTVTGNALGCFGSTIGTITVNPIPVVTVGSATICFGESTTLTASGADTYSWSNGSVINSTTDNPTTTTSYTITGNSLGCLASAIATITVNPIPLVTVGSTTICNGESATLTASGADNYSWSTGAAINTITDNPATTTSYTVTGNSLGCIASAVATITVNPIPVVTVNSATICFGESATLTASGADNYSWSTGATINTITDNPATTTSYTVTGNSLGCIASAVATITVNPIPLVTVGSATICNGESATLTASGADNYSWSSGSVINSITDNPTSTTSYTVTGNSLGCVASAIATITVNPIPVVTVNSATICFGESATLTASGADNYTWSTGAAINTITDDPATTTSYTVTGNSLGCIASAVATITVNPIPVVAVNSATICFGESATLTASGADNYTWSTGAAINAITDDPASTTSYTVTGNSLGCVASAIATITVNPIPVVTVGSATICFGGSATLTASGANTYSWSNGGAINSITDNPTTTTSYTVTGNSLGCVASAIAMITVNPLPVVTVSSTSVCPGVTATLQASGATSYSWSTGDLVNAITINPTTTTSYTVTGNTLGCIGSAIGTVNILVAPIVTVSSDIICIGETATLSATGASGYMWSNGATTEQISITPTSTTNYTVSGTGCPNSTVGTVTVNPLPLVTVSSATICFGESATITASGADTYSWSNGDTNNSITDNPSATTTTYTVTGNSLGCLASAIATITVNPIPVVTVNSATICNGESATLTASGADAYSWSTGAATNAITDDPATTTSYTVTGNSLGCIASAVATITVNPLPIVTVNSTSVCPGVTATLQASGASTYSWSTGAVVDAITINTVTTETYTVTGNTLGCIASAIGTVNIIAAPIVSVSSAIICIGETATLTAMGASGYSWSNGATTDQISISPTSTTNYTVSGTGCPNTTVGTVTVNPKPVVTVSSATICEGESATLTASGASTYSWSNGDMTSSMTTSPTSTTSYTVTGDPLGCSQTAVTTITVNPLPIVTVSSTSVCPGVTATLQASGATSYSWSTGAVVNAITINTVTTESYTVTGNTLGCIASSIGTVNIIGAPIVTVSSAIICIGETAALSAMGASGYSWSNGATTDQISITPTSTTNYTVSGTGCPNSTVGTVTVNPKPVVTVSSATICEGESATLTASGASSYSWSNGDVTSSMTTSPTSTTSYTVTGDPSGCSQTAITTITVNPLPVITVNSATICSGEIAVLTASGASSYSWSNGDADNSITESPTATTPYIVTGNALGCLTSATAAITVNPIPVVTVSSATVCFGQSATLTASGANTYAWSNGDVVNFITDDPTTNSTYTVTGNSLGCVGSAVASITVNPIPVVTVNSATVCFGQSATLTASGADSYLWSTADVSSSITGAPTLNTSYTVTGNTLGCLGSAIATITVNSLPVVTASSATICYGESGTLTASGANTYSWSTGSAVNTITESPATTTSYTVTGNSLGCLNSAIASITVNSLPVVTASSTTVCYGESATLTASGAGSYFWSNGDTDNSITVSPTVNTSYTVTGSTLGCIGTAVGSITIIPLPVVTVSSVTICFGDTATLSASGADSYFWTPANSSNNPITVQPDSTTVYTVTGTRSGCTSTAIASVTVIPLPIAQFDMSPNPAKIIDPIIFTDRSSSDVRYWFWDFGDGDTLAPNTSNPVHSYPEREAEYLVTLIVHNGRCYNTISNKITIGPVYSFFIPNAFTPDGNRVNDGFNGKGVGIIKYHLTIFDRWGNFIWDTHSLDEDWDGRANNTADMDTFYIKYGKQSEMDTYVWKVDLTDVFNVKHQYIGIVTLVR